MESTLFQTCFIYFETPLSGRRCLRSAHRKPRCRAPIPGSVLGHRRNPGFVSRPSMESRVRFLSIDGSRVRFPSIDGSRVRPLSIRSRFMPLNGQTPNPSFADGQNPNPICAGRPESAPGIRRRTKTGPETPSAAKIRVQDSADGRNPSPKPADGRGLPPPDPSGS